MKSLVTITFIYFFSLLSIAAQDCFMPPDGYTLYTTTNPLYNPPSITGFITLGPDLSGNWNVNSTTGSAVASFSDDDGRTSTLSISGLGDIIIDNTVTNISTTAVTSCQQTFTLANYTPTVFSNPPLPAACPINIAVVIDESESIAANMSAQIVRDAVFALATGLENSGSTMAVVEFDTHAERIVINGSDELQTIDASFLTGLSTYLSSGYNPVGDVLNLVGGTNWEDAINHANNITGADLVLMITDGRPTFYTTSMGMNGVAGEGLIFDVTALKHAQDAANALKDSGKRIFIAGLDFPTDIQPLRDISGNTEFLIGQGNMELLSSDFTRVAPASLVPLLSQLGTVCEVEVIPTMGEWGIIITLLLILICFVIGLNTTPQKNNTLLRQRY